MHLLVVGGQGQLGRALTDEIRRQNDIELTVWNRPGHDVTEARITDQVADLSPDLVINASAWTDVDGAEALPDAAYAVNALGPKYLAEGCARCDAGLVHVSTNEIFAGEPDSFYREYDQTRPAGVYARSKLAGERAARTILDNLFIIRVAWLFGSGGNNFPAKITAAADRYGALRVVADEFGNPTYAPDAATAILKLIRLGRRGIYHIVNDGYTSRFDFAAALLERSGRAGVPLTPIPSSEWPRPAPPPRHAVLINQAAAALAVELRPWQEALDAHLNTNPFPAPGSASGRG